LLHVKGNERATLEVGPARECNVIYFKDLNDASSKRLTGWTSPGVGTKVYGPCTTSYYPRRQVLRECFHGSLRMCSCNHRKSNADVIRWATDTPWHYIRCNASRSLDG